MPPCPATASSRCTLEAVVDLADENPIGEEALHQHEIVTGVRGALIWLPVSVSAVPHEECTMKLLPSVVFAVVAAFGPLSVSWADPPIVPTQTEEANALFYSMPNDYFRALNGPAIVVEGQTLHPKFQYYLNSRKSDMPAAQMRAQQKKRLLDPIERARMLAGTDRTWTYRTKITAPMKFTEDLKITGPGGIITARAYVPKTPNVEVLPVMVYFHGGGWLFASVDAADRAMRLLANEASVIVISSNYRMAPEHKFPSAHDDAYAVYKWARANAAAFGGDPNRVGIGGDSAGGNMAVSVSYQMIREGASPPAMQLLYYPAVDRRKELYASTKTFGEGFGLDLGFAKLMEELVFTSKNDVENVRLSPMIAPSFKGMPPAIVATSGFDYLRDQGKAYAERLRKDGVTVQYTNYPSLIHGWMQWSGVIDDADKACVDTARATGKMLRM